MSIKNKCFTMAIFLLRLVYAYSNNAIDVEDIKNDIFFLFMKDIIQTDLPLKTTHVSFKNEFNFWNVHGIMNTSGLLQSKRSPSGFTLSL